VIDHYFNFELGGDGQVYTSVEDLLFWDRNFYDPIVGGSEFLEQMLTRGVLDSGDTLDYAFGLGIGEYRGQPIVSHGGAWGGFRADLVRFPEQRFSVACLCNVANAEPGVLARRVADFYLADWLSPEVTVDEEESGAAVASVSEQELARFTGYYWNSAAGYSRRLISRDGKLFYQRGPGNETELAPLGGGRFVMVGVGARVEVAFEPVGEKPRRMIVVVDGGDPSVYESYKPVVLDPDEMQNLAGEYYSVELNARYAVEALEGRLVLRASEELEAGLQPVISDVFTVPAFGLTVRFSRDGSGTIVGFLLDAGRVKNLRFERV
jgi:hypothetical protein